MGQGTTREIMVYTDEAQQYSIGEEVNVSARQTMGLMAVLLCYVLPLIILVAILAAMTFLGYSEGISALATLGCLAIYFALLGLTHKHISKKVVFTINKI